MIPVAFPTAGHFGGSSWEPGGAALRDASGGRSTVRCQSRRRPPMTADATGIAKRPLFITPDFTEPETASLGLRPQAPAESFPHPTLPPGEGREGDLSCWCLRP